MLRFPRVLPALAAASLLSACATGALQTPQAASLSNPSTIADATPRKQPAVPPLDMAEAESPLLQLALVTPRERPADLTTKAGSELPDVPVEDTGAETLEVADETTTASEPVETPILDVASLAPRNVPANVAQVNGLPEAPVAETVTPEAEVTPLLNAASIAPRKEAEIAQAGALPEVPAPHTTVAESDADNPGILGGTVVAFAETLPGYETGAPRGLRLIDRRIPADVEVAMATAIPQDTPVSQLASAEEKPADAGSKAEPLSLTAALAELENPVPEMEPIADEPAPKKVASAEFKGAPRARPAHIAQGGPEVPLVFELRR